MMKNFQGAKSEREFLNKLKRKINILIVEKKKKHILPKKIIICRLNSQVLGFFFLPSLQ